MQSSNDSSLRAAVIEGCGEMAEVSLELERDFHLLEEEVQRALDGELNCRATCFTLTSE